MMHGQNSYLDLIINKIPPNSVGAELGVWKGHSSKKFAVKASKLYLVDSWSVEPYKNLSQDQIDKFIDRYYKLVKSRDLNDFQLYYDNVYNKVVSTFKNNSKVIVKRMSTNQFFEELDEKLDWVYVDADHYYEGCLMDLNNSYKNLKDNGIIFGDDYGGKKPGVKQAVDEFVESNNLTISLHQNQFVIRT